MAKPKDMKEIEARIHGFNDGFGKGYANQIAQLVDDAEFIAEQLAAKADKDLKTHQMRRFYSEIITVNSMDDNAKLKKYQMAQLLRPKFAYISARAEGWKTISKVIENSLTTIKHESVNDDFQMFKDFFEAILAYHKYQNPKSQA